MREITSKFSSADPKKIDGCLEHNLVETNETTELPEELPDEGDEAKPPTTVETFHNDTTEEFPPESGTKEGLIHKATATEQNKAPSPDLTGDAKNGSRYSSSVENPQTVPCSQNSSPIRVSGADFISLRNHVFEVWIEASLVVSFAVLTVKSTASREKYNPDTAP